MFFFCCFLCFFFLSPLGAYFDDSELVLSSSICVFLLLFVIGTIILLHTAEKEAEGNTHNKEEPVSVESCSAISSANVMIFEIQHLYC